METKDLDTLVSVLKMFTIGQLKDKGFDVTKTYNMYWDTESLTAFDITFIDPSSEQPTGDRFIPLGHYEFNGIHSSLVKG